MRTYYYFKIFNNIKSEHEPNQLAYLELQSLFGQIEPIRNFVDFLVRPPLSYFLADPIRIQDIITMELPYGRIQGYYGEKLNLGEVTNLVRRLAYTREIFLIFESQKHPKDLLRIIFPEGVINKNVQFFKNDNLNLFRFITNQYFLEKSQYISKISNTKKDVDKNIEILFSYLTNNFLKIPSSSTLYYEKKLADYFTIREEKSLYLNHYMHPYKGKFHPKMVRSLINYVLPNEKGIILDNFAGSGTSLLEACYLGINSFGVEINPLSVLMANVKCQSNSINLPNLAEKRDFFIKKIREKIENLEKNSTVSKIQQNRKFSKMYEEIDYISNYLGSIHGLNKQEKLIEKIILAKDIIKEFNEKQLRDFFLLTLSGTISDILRRTKKSFILAFNNRITDLFLRIYLFQKMNEILRINLGKGITFLGDTKKLFLFTTNSIDGIITSPPYSTALDYINNDFPQLLLLNLVDSWELLEKNMIGNPRINFNKAELNNLSTTNDDPLKYSKNACKYINLFVKNDKQIIGMQIYKFFKDILYSLKEMYRVLKKDSKCCLILGNNHFRLNKKYIEIPNDLIILELSKHIGFKEDVIIKRDLHKSSFGNIKNEMIMILKK